MRREVVQLERSLLLARDKAREAEGEARQLREHGAAGGCGGAREREREGERARKGGGRRCGERAARARRGWWVMQSADAR
jgi:hypothetical protein